MAGVARAVVSTPPLCVCSSSRTNSASAVSASSSSPFQRLIQVPRQCSLRLRPELSCSTSSSTGVSLRQFTNRTKIRLSSSSPSPSSTKSCLEDSSNVEKATAEPISFFLLRSVGALCSGSFVLATAGAAIAETLVLTPPEPSADEVPTDYVLSALFIAAFIGLAVLTVGVCPFPATPLSLQKQGFCRAKCDSFIP
jgi:hypothetical protein